MGDGHAFAALGMGGRSVSRGLALGRGRRMVAVTREGLKRGERRKIERVGKGQGRTYFEVNL